MPSPPHRSATQLDAIELCRRAGEIAERKLAYEEAAEQYRRALMLAERSPNTDKTTRLHLEIAVAVARLNTGDESACRQLHVAVETARREGYDEALISASYALTVMGDTIGRGQEPTLSSSQPSRTHSTRSRPNRADDGFGSLPRSVASS